MIYKRGLYNLWRCIALLISFFLLYSLSAAQNLQRYVASLDWKPDGSQIAVGYSDGVVEILDANGDLLETFSFEDSIINVVAWRPNSSELAILTQSLLIIINPQTGTRYSQETPRAEVISWSPDGMMIASDGIGDNAPIYIRDALTLDTIQTLPGFYRDSVGPIAWHPIDNDIIATGTFRGILRVWRVSTGEELHFQQHPLESGVDELAWNYDASKIAIAYSGLIDILQTTDWQILAQGGQNSIASDIAWNPTGSLIASVGDDDIWITDALTGENVSLIDVGVYPGAVAWSPDGSKFAYGNADNSITIIATSDIDSLIK